MKSLLFSAIAVFISSIAISQRHWVQPVNYYRSDFKSEYILQTTIGCETDSCYTQLVLQLPYISGADPEPDSIYWVIMPIAIWKDDTNPCTCTLTTPDAMFKGFKKPCDEGLLPGSAYSYLRVVWSNGYIHEEEGEIGY